MKHGVAGRKFGRNTKHRKSLLTNLAASVLEHEQVVTTLPKAKDIRPVVEKLITLGKKGGLANRRLAASRLHDEDVVKKLFDELAKRYAGRAGGYCRIMKAGFRVGDNAPLAVIELVDRDPNAKGARQRAIAEAEAAEMAAAETTAAA